MKRIVERLNLAKHLGTDTARQQLVLAGYRNPSSESAFLFFRLVTPIVLFVLTALYIFVLYESEYSPIVKFGICLGAMLFGIKAPELFLKNQTLKRQLSMNAGLSRFARPAPDLRRIRHVDRACLSQGLDRDREPVSAVAEEFTLTTAETVLFAGPAHGLRESRLPHGP